MHTIESLVSSNRNRHMRLHGAILGKYYAHPFNNWSICTQKQTIGLWSLNTSYRVNVVDDPMLSS